MIGMVAPLDADWQLHKVGDASSAAAEPESHQSDVSEEVGGTSEGYNNSDTGSDCELPPLVSTVRRLSKHESFG